MGGRAEARALDALTLAALTCALVFPLALHWSRRRRSPAAERPPPRESGASACPVLDKGGANHGLSDDAANAAAAAGCPVIKAPAARPCASDELNPLNRMPQQAKQERAAGQEGDLSTDRVESTIPTGSGSRWVYPSPQMFYNALVRKGKSEGVEEQNMDAVVAIHNNMNETTWRQVLEWEDLHCDECKQARKLVRFVGRPDELSPKAAVAYYLGLRPKPFDRHDWTVDRCGKEVRYIIDYYDVAEKRAEDRLPALHDDDAVPSIECVVRPAGDSIGDLVDRVRMTVAKATTSMGGLGGANAAAEQQSQQQQQQQQQPEAVVEPSAASSSSSSSAVADAVRDACADKIAALQACTDEQGAIQAHIGLTFCVAKQVCAAEAKAFAALTGSNDNAAAGVKFEEMEACVARWGQSQQAAAAE